MTVEYHIYLSSPRGPERAFSRKIKTVRNEPSISNKTNNNGSAETRQTNPAEPGENPANPALNPGRTREPGALPARPGSLFTTHAPPLEFTRQPFTVSRDLFFGHNAECPQQFRKS
jgi:hypothetical protein